MNLSIVNLYLEISMAKKRRKLNKDFERKIYSSKKNVELVLAKIYDIDDEDIQKEYMKAFNKVVYLYDELKELLISKPQIKHITLFGHSYGGNIVTGISGMPNLGSIEIHSIAGALIPIKRLKKNCPYFVGFHNHKSLYPHFQWRTVKDQDGAFKNLPFDPQVVEIDGSQIIQLPSKRPDGSRLGHNRSVTWAIDYYFKN